MGRSPPKSPALIAAFALYSATSSPVGANEEWNRTVTGGLYEETVSGLTGQGKPILTRGAFRLTKVNDVKTIKSGGSLD